MREVNFIENKGRFGITFMSDDIAEANAVMNAIQRFISKVSKKETKENIDDNCQSSVGEHSEKILEEDNGIISFGEDDSNYRIDEECEEDPLSVDANNINRWDYDADGDKVDSEGNKMLFDY